MYIFKVKKGHKVYLGSVALTVLEDTEFLTEASSPDLFAEQLFAHGGQRMFGEHVADLAHDEVVTRMIDGRAHDVDVSVSYGAGGARIQVDKEGSQPRPQQPAAKAGTIGALRQPPGVGDAVGEAAERGGIGMETTPGASGTDAPAIGGLREATEDEIGAFRSNPRTEFVVPPKRFPDEVQTATDPPREQIVADSPERATPYVGEFTQTGAFTRQPSSSPGVVDRSGTEGRQAPSPDTPGTPGRVFPEPSNDAKNLPDQAEQALSGSREKTGEAATGESEEDLSDLNEENTSSEDEADELPEDFPHRDLLENAGATKYSDLEGKTAEDLSGEDFKGIGPVGAGDILAALKSKKRRDAYRAKKRAN